MRLNSQTDRYCYDLAGKAGRIWVARDRVAALAVKLSWQHSYISEMTYKPNKLGQTDLAFDL